MATHHKTAEELIASVAAQCRPVVTAPKAYAHHVASNAQVEAIRCQHEARTSAPGYIAALGAFGSPKAAVAFVNAQVEANRPALKIAAE